MAAGETETKLLIPQLKPFYDLVKPLSWALLRITVGLVMIPSGWGKWSTGFDSVVAIMVKWGISPPGPFAVVILINETIGALCVALGLFTRVFATALAIQLLIITYVRYPLGEFNNRLFLMWGLAMLAVALCGGGPYSLDRKIGREL
jgi:putative oxidoreductase